MAGFGGKGRVDSEVPKFIKYGREIRVAPKVFKKLQVLTAFAGGYVCTIGKVLAAKAVKEFWAFLEMLLKTGIFRFLYSPECETHSGQEELKGTAATTHRCGRPK